MSEAHRNAIRRSNAMRGTCCAKCKAPGLETIDGAKIGGMPGLQYRVCNGCGWAKAITKRG